MIQSIRPEDRVRAARDHAEIGAAGSLTPGTPEWADWVKDYYRSVETYDWVDVTDRLRGLEALFHRNRARVVSRLTGQFGRPPILDAGCGTGLNLRHLPVGSSGLDINPYNVALARARLPDHHVFEGDIEAMPFRDAAFGTVVCTEVLEHIPDPVAGLREIRRVLRPGGMLIGSVPARSPIWRLRFLSSTCPHSEPFHHEYRPREVRRLLSEWDIVQLRLSLLRVNVVFVARRRE